MDDYDNWTGIDKNSVCGGDCGGEVQEKGHGSATDMFRRKMERQTSERDVGMLDILIPQLSESAFHQEIPVRFPQIQVLISVY